MQEDDRDDCLQKGGLRRRKAKKKTKEPRKEQRKRKQD
jgi:hypothetical protein